MHELIQLRVFVDNDGGHGNPVGVVLDEGMELAETDRIAITSQTGYSECVFIDDVSRRKIRTYTGQQEIPFAGHAALGAAWCFSHVLELESLPLAGPEGPIQVSGDGDVYWVAAELKTTPPWWHERLPSADAVSDLSGPQSDSQIHTQLWAWIDEEAGRLRSRTFAPEWGIPEDEANGSGCMRLASALGREIEVHHGAGSVIFARPTAPGIAEVGGRVAQDETTSVDLP